MRFISYPGDEEHFAEIEHWEDLQEAGCLQCVLQVLHVERELGRVDEVDDLLQAHAVHAVQLYTHQVLLLHTT